MIPQNVANDLTGLEASETDQIEYLKGQLQIAQEALEDEKKVSADLGNKNKILADNQPIKNSAVRFAKVFLVAIPVTCIFIFVMSFNDVSAPVSNGVAAFFLKFNVELNPYTQTALIVSPIVFVGAVIGFLLKGAFASKEDDGIASGLTNLAAVARLLK